MLSLLMRFHCFCNQTRINELLDDITKQNDDADNLRSTATALDREKDALQAALDERTEREAELDHQLNSREREIADLKIMISNLEVSGEKYEC